MARGAVLLAALLVVVHGCLADETDCPAPGPVPDCHRTEVMTIAKDEKGCDVIKCKSCLMTR